jgi:hypothetical protein
MASRFSAKTYGGVAGRLGLTAFAATGTKNCKKLDKRGGNLHYLLNHEINAGN